MGIHHCYNYKILIKTTDEQQIAFDGESWNNHLVFDFIDISKHIPNFELKNHSDSKIFDAEIEYYKCFGKNFPLTLE